MKKILALDKCRKAFLLGVGAAVVVFLVLALTNSGVYIAKPRFLQKLSQTRVRAWQGDLLLCPGGPYTCGFAGRNADDTENDDLIQRIEAAYADYQDELAPGQPLLSMDKWWSFGGGQSADFGPGDEPPSDPEGPGGGGIPPPQPGGGQQCQPRRQDCILIFCFQAPCPSLCPPQPEPPGPGGVLF